MPMDKEKRDNSLTIFAFLIFLVLVSCSSYDRGYEKASEEYKDLREAVYDDGYSYGFDEGYEYGYKYGYEDAYSESYRYGYDESYRYGYNDGYDEGIATGIEQGNEYGYEEGYYDGYVVGYEDGNEDGAVAELERFFEDFHLINPYTGKEITNLSDFKEYIRQYTEEVRSRRND